MKILAALALCFLPSCRGYTLGWNVSYEQDNRKFGVGGTIYRPGGKSPVPVNPQK